MRQCKTILLRLFLVICILGLIPPSCLAQPQDKVVRVGFPIIKGFSEVGASGNISGYTFDYLNEISRYTGWKYEFVVKQQDGFPELLDMLAKGEIDVMGGVAKNPQTEALFNFPDYNCGTTYATLSIAEDDTRFSQSDYQTLNGMRVACLKSADARMKKLDRFCVANGIQLQFVLCSSEEELYKALSGKTADAVLSSDLVVHPGERILARFADQPYYFAVSQSNATVLDGLNSAIAKIKEVNPYFDLDLYTEHFPRRNANAFSLTAAEQEYVAAHPKIRVVSVANTTPVDYVDENGTYKGISHDILSRISALSGLQFEYTAVASLQEAYRMMTEGEADLITNIADDVNFLPLNDLALTVPYLKMPKTLVRRKNIAAEDIGFASLAMTGGRQLLNGTRDGEVKVYESLKDCMKAVERGEAEYCYGNAYSADYYQKSLALRKVSLDALPQGNLQSCFGLSHPADQRLLGILNKAIGHISAEELQQIILNNNSAAEYDVSFDAFLRTYTKETLLGMGLLFLLIISMVIFFFRKQRKTEHHSYRRYRTLSDMLDEAVFEYTYQNDCLFLSENFAHRLGLKAVNYHFSETAEKLQGIEKSKLFRAFEEKSEQPEQQWLEFSWKLPEGGRHWFRCEFVLYRDKGGRPETCIGKLRSIDQEREERNKLLEMAQRDLLTGLYNKGTTEVLCKEFLAKENAAGAILIVDLDNFKHVNDTLGHQEGDHVLRESALALKSAFGKRDILGRVGGDEFLILTRELCHKENLAQKAEGIIRSVQTLGKGKTKLSCSVGISIFPENGTSFDKLYECADRALYQVKNSGKMGCQFYHPSMEQSVWVPYTNTEIDSESISSPQNGSIL